MKAIINVGGTDSGKTTRTKKILRHLKGCNFFIYDVNGEYAKEFTGCVQGVLWKDFLKKAATKTNTVIVFEEATMFFQHNNKTDEILSLLVRKIHTNNLIIMNFHSLRAVPVYILDYCDEIYIHETNDVPTAILSKFDGWTGILDAFNLMRKIKDSKPTFVRSLKTCENNKTRINGMDIILTRGKKNNEIIVMEKLVNLK